MFLWHNTANKLRTYEELLAYFPLSARCLLFFCSSTRRRQHTERTTLFFSLLFVSIANQRRSSPSSVRYRTPSARNVLANERISHLLMCVATQFQQLLKSEKAPSSSPSLAPAAENGELAAKDGGFEPVSTRVSPTGEGVRQETRCKRETDGGGRPSGRLRSWYQLIAHAAHRSARAYSRFRRTAAFGGSWGFRTLNHVVRSTQT